MSGQSIPSDENILQRFRSGRSTFQIAFGSSMPEAEVERALHRAVDAEYQKATDGEYLSDLLEIRRHRRIGDDDAPQTARPDFEQPFAPVARQPSER